VIEYKSAMLTLYDIPLSPYAQKVKMAMLEKGLAFDTVIPEPLDSPEFRAISPRLEVPVLVHDGVKLFDSTVIMEYLEDAFPEQPMRPASAAERARVRTLEEICDTAYDAVTWGVAEIAVFKRATGDVAATMLENARTQIAGINARLERDLQGRPFFNGEQFGYGDIAVYPFVNGAAGVGYKPAPGGALDTWLREMRKRPSAQRIKQDVIDTLARFMKRGEEIAAGTYRRQYRDHRLDWMMRSGGMQIVLEGAAAGTLRFSTEFD
jgi:glutathione S-transferase/RNA polymerase-associated protein